MSPTTESAPHALVEGQTVPAEILGGGELVLLATRPSAWFILLVSWPMVAPAGVAGVALALAGHYWRLSTPYEVTAILCLAAGFLRVAVAAFQWMGRLYVLTNRRLLWISGISHVDMSDCMLTTIAAVSMCATRGEHLVGIGNLIFERRTGGEHPHAWMCLANPAQVQQKIEQAISKAL
jgi:hypothetical protein